MKCPKCGAPLEELAGDGATVQACPACNGSFYNASEMGHMISLAGVRQTRYACPKCSEPFQEALAMGGNLALDHCPKCGGIWFDAGEFSRFNRLLSAKKKASLPELAMPDLTVEEAERLAQPPPRPPSWSEAGRRLLAWAALVALTCSAGPLHRAWVVRHDAEHAEIEQTQEETRQAMAKLQQAIDALPPEGRRFLAESGVSVRIGKNSTPVMRWLVSTQTGKFSAEEFQAESRVRLEKLLQFQRRWEGARGWIGWLLWFIAAGAAGGFLWAFLNENPRGFSAIGHHSGTVARLWGEALAFGGAAIFTATQNNPWGSMPRAYLVAPLALGAIHALEGISAGAAWIRLALILVPPAAGAAVTALFERFLG